MSAIKNALGFALTGLFLWQPVASATDAACEGCSFPQMIIKAKSLGQGEHRIYSLSTGTMRGFSVTCSGTMPMLKTRPLSTQGLTSANPSFGGFYSCPNGLPRIVENMPLDGPTQSAWSATLLFYNQNGQNLSQVDIDLSTSDLPGGGEYLDSVYPMLSDYQARIDLYDIILNNSSDLANYKAALTRGITAFFNILPYEIVVKVTFKDGSTVKLQFNASVQELTQVPNTARAANGAAVIEHNAPMYQGNYSTAGMDLGAYLDYLRSMGVIIIRGGTHGTLACVAVSGDLQCTVYYDPL